MVVTFSGPEGTRTLDPHNAIVVLSQLSYRPLNFNSYSGQHCNTNFAGGHNLPAKHPLKRLTALPVDNYQAVWLFAAAAPRRVRYVLSLLQPVKRLSAVAGRPGRVPTTPVQSFVIQLLTAKKWT